MDIHPSPVDHAFRTEWVPPVATVLRVAGNLQG